MNKNVATHCINNSEQENTEYSLPEKMGELERQWHIPCPTSGTFGRLPVTSEEIRIAFPRSTKTLLMETSMIKSFIVIHEFPEHKCERRTDENLAKTEYGKEWRYAYNYILPKND